MKQLLFHAKKLFNGNNNSLSNELKLILNISYFFFGVFIWANLYRAQFKEYDENWALIIIVFVFSATIFTLLTIIGFKRNYLIKDNAFSTIIFLLTCSPITISIVVFNYSFIFGKLDV